MFNVVKLDSPGPTLNIELTVNGYALVHKFMLPF